MKQESVDRASIQFSDEKKSETNQKVADLFFELRDDLESLTGGDKNKRELSGVDVLRGGLLKDMSSFLRGPSVDGKLSLRSVRNDITNAWWVSEEVLQSFGHLREQILDNSWSGRIELSDVITLEGVMALTTVQMGSYEAGILDVNGKFHPVSFVYEVGGREVIATTRDEVPVWAKVKGLKIS